MNYKKNKIELEENGYSVLSDLYSDNEISEILACIENAEQDGNSFMKTKDLWKQVHTILWTGSEHWELHDISLLDTLTMR